MELGKGIEPLAAWISPANAGLNRDFTTNNICKRVFRTFSVDREAPFSNAKLTTVKRLGKLDAEQSRKGNPLSSESLPWRAISNDLEEIAKHVVN